MTALSAEDLNMISKHIGDTINKRIDDMVTNLESRVASNNEVLTKSIRGLQEVNEVNHNSLHSNMKVLKDELFEVKAISLKTEGNSAKTNGRVTILELKVKELDETFEDKEKIKAEKRIEALEHKVDGELDVDGNIVPTKKGLIKDLEEIKRYRPFYLRMTTPLLTITILYFVLDKYSDKGVEAVLKLFSLFVGLF